jgi:hypothetical protein
MSMPLSASNLEDKAIQQSLLFLQLAAAVVEPQMRTSHRYFVAHLQTTVLDRISALVY